MTFGEKLQYLRKSNGLSQEQLAEHLNISRQAVSRWETGAIPDVENVVKISRYFDCSLDYLLNNEVEHMQAPVQQEPQPHLQREPIQPKTMALLVAALPLLTVVVLYIVSIFAEIDASIRDLDTGMYYIGFGKFIQYYGLQTAIYLCAIIWSIAISVRMYFQLFTQGQWKNKKYFACRIISWCLYLLGSGGFVYGTLSPSGGIWIENSIGFIAVYLGLCVMTGVIGNGSSW